MKEHRCNFNWLWVLAIMLCAVSGMLSAWSNADQTARLSAIEARLNIKPDAKGGEK